MRPLIARPSLLGAILAVLVGIGAYTYLNATGGDEATSSGQTASVVVARNFIERRTPLTPELFEVRQLPVEAVTALAVRSIDAIDGQFVTNDLQPGEQLLTTDLTARPEGGNLSLLIPEGHRAFSVAISDAMAAGGLVEPGDRIDILAVFDEGTTGKNGAAVVVQDVEILAVSSLVLGESPSALEGNGGRSNNPTSLSSTVTVALTPDEAQLVALAEEFGGLRLTLRRPDDTAQIAANQTELEALIGGLPASAVTTTTNESTGG